MFLTDFFQQKYYHNTVEQWLISLAIIAGTIGVAKLVYWIISATLKTFTAKTENKLDDLVVAKLEKPAILGIILIGLNIALSRLHFTPKVDEYIHRTFVFLTSINITWLLVRVAHAVIEEYLKPYAKRIDNQINDQMVMLIERGVGIVFWTIGIIVGLNNAGFDVGALIAGLGIGGLALALAAQDTVKNIFGGVMIFLDKPFEIGDRIVINSYDGNVEYIGIRSTRLRTLEGRMVTIPNAQFSDSPIENVTVEPSRRVINVLGLVYSTPPAKIDEAIAILKKISEECSLVINSETVVFFEAFNASSLDIKFVYFIKKGEDIFLTQTTINKMILDRFNAAGLDFAYPTQTIYTQAG